MPLLVILLVIGFVIFFVTVLSRSRQTTPTALISPEPPVHPNSPGAGFTISVTLEPSGSVMTRERRSASSPQTDARWVPTGQTVKLGGYEIAGGLIYVGTQLPRVRGWGDVEPALINPQLKVDQANPNRSGNGMTYWPSYGDISPASRAAYLEWLAGGRKDPTVYIGYVFLFFYGLERRLFHDIQHQEAPPAEIGLIRDELQRLLALYSSNGSFGGYATRLLDSIEVQMPTPSRLYEKPPPALTRSWELPMALRIGLAQLAIDERPIPGPWAFAWLTAHPEIHLRTPGTRCPEEFARLFEIRYGERYGEGLLLRPNKTRLKLNYHPASASFGGLVEVAVSDLPDVSVLAAPVNKLRDLADECCADLDPYSRWIGRNPSGSRSIAAVALLPRELAAEHLSEELATMLEWFQSVVVDEETAIIDTSDLLKHWSRSSTADIAKSDAVLLAQLLEAHGLGLEPDVRYGGPVLTASEKVALFRFKDRNVTPRTVEYGGATVLLRLAAAVAAADGMVSEQEQQHLEAHLETALSLTPSERVRLKGHLKWLLASQPGLTGMKKRLAVLTPNQRRALGQVLVSIAGADGHIGPEEVKVLTKLYQFLELPEALLFTDCHALATSSPTAEEPVTIRPPSPSSRGFKIPPRPEPSTGFSLDMEKVGAKIAETAVVSAMLGDIFVDQDAPATSPTQPESTPAAPVGALDMAQTQFLRALGERSSWARSEIEGLAAQMGLLTDGALDAINELALDLCDEPLCEGEDPIIISGVVFKELTA